MKHFQTEYTTMNLTGQMFSGDMFSTVAQGTASHQKKEDYFSIPGLRFADEISRSFHISQALYAEFKKAQTEKGNPFDITKNFVLKLLQASLEYTDIKETENQRIGNTTYAVNMFAAKNIPLIVVPYTFRVEQNDVRFTVTSISEKKKSAFVLAQLFLNANNDCSWAIVANGTELRLMHESDSLVRPQYVSFDLLQILEGQRYPDYAAFWYIMHSSRVTIWDKWRTEAVTQGSRVRDGLRIGVTDALLHLGAGFLQTAGKGNDYLRSLLQNGKTEDGTVYTQINFYHELLRVIYRFLFLSTLEERNLLFAHNGEDSKLDSTVLLRHRIYKEGYGLHRLALRSKKITTSDHYTDLWQGIKIVFKSLQNGNEKLDLDALGGLFKADQCPVIDTCEIDNTHVMRAIRKLRWCYIDKTLTFTDYRNMDTEEFGSVYESLLELVPRVDLESHTFSFIGIGDERGTIEEGSSTGNTRKLTGSYYTPTELVQSLIQSALVPAVNIKIANEKKMADLQHREVDEEKALLEMKIVDPACGSGHFLLAAARYIAQILAERRNEKSGELETVGDMQYRKALRDVVCRCLYGVDLNPMAVELTRTALWLEGYEPGKPLGFLDNHIKCGNSVVGVFDYTITEKGIPDKAYTLLSGDDKNKCTSLKKHNAKQRRENIGGQSIFDFGVRKDGSFDEYSTLVSQISFMKNDTVEEVQAAEKKYKELLQSKDYIKRRTACNLYTAAFFIAKTAQTEHLVPQTEDIKAVIEEVREPIGKEGTRKEADRISQENSFFHWKLEFPEVFIKNAGFDCVIGNPPWDKVKLQEKEFFAQRAPEIAEAANKSDRDIMIQDLVTGDPYEKALYAEFENSCHTAEATSIFVHFKNYPDCRYPLTGTGDVNLYALFAELFLTLRGTDGTAGFVVPSGIATDDGTKLYFEKIATGGMLKSLYDFENRESLFPTVDSRVKFCLVTLAPKEKTSDFAFFIHTMDELEDERRHFTMSAEDFDLINPNTHTCPVFRSKKDAGLTKQIYKKAGVFIKECDKDTGNPWEISFKTIYHMSNDSGLFSKTSGKTVDGSDLLPLYEAKMMHQFDHRWNTFASIGKVQTVTEEQKKDPRYHVMPEYWVSRQETVLRTTSLPNDIVKALRVALSASDSNALYNLAEVCRKHPENKEIDELIKNHIAHGHWAKEVYALAEKMAPKYLMGWRGITNVTNERTVIADIIPFVGIGHSAILFTTDNSIQKGICLISNLDTIILDYFARQKIGGSNLTLGYIKQFPVLPPSTYTSKDIAFIVPRVFALTYTAYDMEEWAKALWNSGSLDLRLALLHAAVNDTGNITDTKFVDREFSTAFIPPVEFNIEKRAVLRAELDAYYARLYGLNRTDLQYILDPTSTEGKDYPSVTFPVLRDNEIKQYGEYRTQRLVLEAWDKLDRGE